METDLLSMLMTIEVFMFIDLVWILGSLLFYSVLIIVTLMPHSWNVKLKKPFWTKMILEDLFLSIELPYLLFRILRLDFICISSQNLKRPWMIWVAVVMSSSFQSSAGVTKFWSLTFRCCIAIDDITLGEPRLGEIAYKHMP